MNALPETSDGVGEMFVMGWSRQATPLEAIERALYALADQISGVVHDDEDGRWTVSVYPRSATARRPSLEHSIRQEVTDQTLRVRIAERTDPIRNLVFAVAFSHLGNSTAPPADAVAPSAP